MNVTIRNYSSGDALWSGDIPEIAFARYMGQAQHPEGLIRFSDLAGTFGDLTIDGDTMVYLET